MRRLRSARKDTQPAVVRVAVVCGLCGHRTLLRPAPYVDNQVVRLVCASCAWVLEAIVWVPHEGVEEPAWYRHLQRHDLPAEPH